MTKQPSISALLNPRNVVLVGASDRPGHWSSRVWDNLRRHGFPGAVYPVNPGRARIWDVPCHPDLVALPEPPDHLALFVPADVCLEVLEAGGRLGARGATIFAAGFGEGGDADGRARARRLREILDRTGIAAAGPNCMGLACGHSGLVTLADETLQRLGPGPVAAITQSGLLASSFNRALSDRGLMVSHLISCGNQTGLTLADYIDYLSDDPSLKVIVCYIEMIPDADRFLVAAAKARDNGKTIVCVKIGSSEQGRAAALAHTGALVGSLDAFDCLAGRAGIIRVGGLEETIEAAELLSHAARPCRPAAAFMTNSGALKSLMTEAAERHGVRLAGLSPQTRAAIRTALGEGAEPANPLDTKRTLPTDAYMACVAALARDPEVGLLVLIEEMPRETGIARKVANLRALDELVQRHGAALPPIAVLTPLPFAETPYMQDLRRQLPHLPMLRNIDTTFRMLGSVQAAFDHARPRTIETAPSRRPRIAVEIARDAAQLPHPMALDEVEAKRLVAAYGIGMPREEIVQTEADAVAAAGRIGYPVVLKGVSAGLAHKSDAGLVLLGIANEDAARAGCATLQRNAARAGAALGGIIVAEQVMGGVEMVVGVHRDPEMGPVLMVGLGGIWLEVINDVAFAPIDLDRASALSVIGRTKAAKLLAGFRGQPACDVEALADAMIAMGRLAADLGDTIQSIEINPLLVRAAGRGAVALDALAVLQPAPK